MRMSRSHFSSDTRNESGLPRRTRPGLPVPIPANPFDPAHHLPPRQISGNGRSTLQVRVLSALDALEKSGVIGEMRHHVCYPEICCPPDSLEGMSYGIPTVAALRIESRLVTMLSYEPWVTHPDAVAEHHATRIAAKKLRYTMEVYGPVYRLGLKKPLIRVKKIQEILGDLHDCDVWIDHVTRILLRERSHLRTENEEKRPDTATLASLRLFLKERERARILLHRQFVRFWESQKRTGYGMNSGILSFTGGRRGSSPAPE